MTNIRDQCSWVHKDDPEAATEKALELTSMAVARARRLKALPTGRLPVTASALVIGGGLAGMTAALAIADQGFEVHLAEKEPHLGGMLREVHSTLEGADVQAPSQAAHGPRPVSPEDQRLPERDARRDRRPRGQFQERPERGRASKSPSATAW